MGLGVDRRTDIWSTGATIYSFLAGRVPYNASEPVAVFRRIAAGLPPAPLPGSVPEPFRLVVERALELDVSKRFATAHEMGAALEKAMHDAGVVRDPRRRRRVPHGSSGRGPCGTHAGNRACRPREPGADAGRAGARGKLVDAGHTGRARRSGSPDWPPSRRSRSTGLSSARDLPGDPLDRRASPPRSAPPCRCPPAERKGSRARFDRRSLRPRSSGGRGRKTRRATSRGRTFPNPPILRDSCRDCRWHPWERSSRDCCAEHLTPSRDGSPARVSSSPCSPSASRGGKPLVLVQASRRTWRHRRTPRENQSRSRRRRPPPPRFRRRLPNWIPLPRQPSRERLPRRIFLRSLRSRAPSPLRSARPTRCSSERAGHVEAGASGMPRRCSRRPSRRRPRIRRP